MAKPIPKAKQEPDWAKIRAEWQESEISDVQLAERWGFKSTTTVRRQRLREGWARDIDAIAAKIVTQAVVGKERVRTSSALTRNEADIGLADTKAGEPSDFNDKERVRPQTRQEVSRATKDSDDLGTARHLANVHAQAIRQQIGIGELAISVGTIFLDQIEALAGDDVDRIQRAQAALLSINPEKDTLAGVIKAIAGLLETGVKIKRLALGMDILKNPEGVTPSQVAGGRAASKVIERLDLETLMKLRGAAQEIARLPPPTLEGEASVEEEG